MSFLEAFDTAYLQFPVSEIETETGLLCCVLHALPKQMVGREICLTGRC